MDVEASASNHKVSDDWITLESDDTSAHKNLGSPSPFHSSREVDEEASDVCSCTDIGSDSDCATSPSFISGRVDWKEEEFSLESFGDSYDVNSIFFDSSRLLDYRVTRNETYRSQLKSGFDKLDQFINSKNNGIEKESTDWLFEKTEDIVERLMNETSSNSDNDQEDVGNEILRIFDAQYRADKAVTPLYRTTDDSYFNYSNSGIVWPTCNEELVSQNVAEKILNPDSWTSRKKISPGQHSHIEPDSVKAHGTNDLLAPKKVAKSLKDDHRKEDKTAATRKAVAVKKAKQDLSAPKAPKIPKTTQGGEDGPEQPPAVTDVKVSLKRTVIDLTGPNPTKKPRHDLPLSTDPNYKIPKIADGTTAKRVRFFGWLPLNEENSDMFKRIYEKMGAYSLELNDYSPMKGYITAKEQIADNDQLVPLTECEKRLNEKLASCPIECSFSNHTIEINDLPIFRGNENIRPSWLFGSYAGLFWPAVQSYDAVDVIHDEEVGSSDILRQLSNQSCYSHKRQNMLCCSTDNDRWRVEYDAVGGFTDQELEGRGRFNHRIGFKRAINNENHETIRMRHQENQDEERKWLESRPENTASEECQSDDMKSHVQFNLVDEFSSSMFGGCRTNNTESAQWLSPQLHQYVPALDRCDDLCKTINEVNDSIYEYMKRLMFPETAISRCVARDAFRAAFCFQMEDSTFLCHPSAPELVSFKERSAKLEALLKGVREYEPFVLSDMLNAFQLRDYEFSYWPLIWDSLVSSFKNYPFLYQMLPSIKMDIDRAFCNVAQVSQRNIHFNRYAASKKKKIVETQQRQREAASQALVPTGPSYF